MFKLTIPVRVLHTDCKVKQFDKGEWIDLSAYVPEETKLNKGDHKKISLGIAMSLPKEFEAVLAARSSTFKNFGYILTNGIGVIDSSYAGNNDIWQAWMYKAVANPRILKTGDRICQFRIQPSQKASILTKLKWLFTSKVEFVYVDNLTCEDRGGYGSTGI